MCGIALIFNNNGAIPDEQRLLRMNRALHHRGPDGAGLVIRANVALGHTRLSIVDVAHGAQPMLSTDGQLALVFNGEIYNYQALRRELAGEGVVFHTNSDTEVILELYRREGTACVSRLRGMFSFVIHDRANDCVFIARDRLGIKPLFYAWNGTTLVAASEMKAIFASGLVEPVFNQASLHNYFIYQFAISPHTPFKNILELPPGHQMVLTSGVAPQISQYWDLEFPDDGAYESMDENYWLQHFQAAFEDGVQSHTIGEVPIGAYLSGGVDSSAIAWLLKKHYPKPLQTFSIHLTNPNVDESAAYKAVAAHLGVGNEELTLDDNRPDYLSDLAACIYHLEQPQRLAVDIPHYLLSGLVQKNGYKVVYTGDGADEILGGYDCFRQDQMRVWGNEIADEELRRQRYMTQYTQWFAEDQVRLLFDLHQPQKQAETIKQFGCYPAWFDFWNITGDMLADLFIPEVTQAAQDAAQMETLAEAMKPRLHGKHPLNQSLYIETKTRLPGWILWKSDRLSMSHSVEARVPFMDHPLVELAARMPPVYKLNGMDEKYVLRKIANPNLPQHPTQYKKRAFYTPIREWFFTPDRQASLEPYLSRSAIEEAGLFQYQTVEKLLAKLVHTAQPSSMQDYYQLMKLEWVLTTVLTVQIMYKQFVCKQAPCFAD